MVGGRIIRGNFGKPEIALQQNIVEKKVLQELEKKIGVQKIDGCNSLNLFMDDGSIIQLEAPSISVGRQSSVLAVKAQRAEQKKLGNMSSEIIGELDQGDLVSLQDSLKEAKAQAEVPMVQEATK